MRRSRRDEMHSLPHVLWRLAEKVAPAGAGSFIIPPANRRKGHAGFPCRRRHRKPSCPLLRGGSRPVSPPSRPAPHGAPDIHRDRRLWRSFLTRGTSGADTVQYQNIKRKLAIYTSALATTEKIIQATAKNTRACITWDRPFLSRYLQALTSYMASFPLLSVPLSSSQKPQSFAMTDAVLSITCNECCQGQTYNCQHWRGRVAKNACSAKWHKLQEAPPTMTKMASDTRT